MIGNSERVGAVLLAAGSSTRMGQIDKQLLTLRGLPVFVHSLRTLQASPLVDSICVVFSPSNIEEGQRVIQDSDGAKVVATVIGGERRQDSVRVGVDALGKGQELPQWIVIHDAARPFADEEMLERGLTAARRTGAAVSAVPLKDTVKQVDGDMVTATPDRATLRAVQTPQVFRWSVLKAAHETVTTDVTDDAAMVEQNGGSVVVFDGSYDNIKITTPEDIALAESIWDRRSSQPTDHEKRRWGVGFDGHRLTNGGPLRLGGIDIEFEKGLEGHSDGDVLLHAITSACLGAAGLGDMGSNFPSSDPKLKGIDSSELLSRALARLRSLNWEVEHLDATIIAQQPRLSGHVSAIAERVASIAGLAVGSVNIKVTSTDHVGAIGEGQGIAAQAVATIHTE